MFYLLSMLTGALIALMVAVNGALTGYWGVYPATVAIHVVGLALITVACLLRREKPWTRRGLPLWMYAGGLIGVATTVFNNLAFGRISLSAIVALSLLGQAVTALVIDQFALMGMPRRAFRPAKLAGLLFMLAGCAYMLRGTAFDLIPVVVSLLAGVSVVISRTVNARLCGRSSETVSTWFNYVTGLLLSAIVLLLVGRGELAVADFGGASPWMYLGGALGVAVVLLSNATVERISAFYMTLLLFVGQVFAGIVVDMALVGAFSMTSLIGGALVAIGMVLNLWLDQTRGAMRRP